jgi:HPt (histidine-containing phosphotransfer) domain-containing protein
VSDPLSALRPLFRARAAADLDRLTRLWAENPASPEIGLLIHDIAGGAGVFGFTNLSAVALEINERLVAGDRPDAVQIEQLLTHLNEAAKG